MQAKRTPAASDNPTKRFIEFLPWFAQALNVASLRLIVQLSLLYARLGGRIPLHVGHLSALGLGLRRICRKRRSRDAEQKTRDNRRVENFRHCVSFQVRVFPPTRTNAAPSILPPNVRSLTDPYGSAGELFPCQAKSPAIAEVRAYLCRWAQFAGLNLSADADALKIEREHGGAIAKCGVFDDVDPDSANIEIGRH